MAHADVVAIDDQQNGVAAIAKPFGQRPRLGARRRCGGDGDGGEQQRGNAARGHSTLRASGQHSVF
jgi:hypothetical protein